MHIQEHDETTAWDCDPTAHVTVDAYDLDLDYEDDTGDYQVLALDRFFDRQITDSLDSRGDPSTARCW